MGNFYRNKKILITGGLGFIGSNLAIKLVSLGAKIEIIDALIPTYGGNLFNIEPVSPLVAKIIYWVNVLLLFAGIFGLVQWRWSVKKDIYDKYQYFHLLTIIFLIYITVIYSFSTAYERYSISAYPLIILFAGYAVYFGQRFIRKKHKIDG